jgi:hypothetical protein
LPGAKRHKGHEEQNRKRPCDNSEGGHGILGMFCIEAGIIL